MIGRPLLRLPESVRADRNARRMAEGRALRDETRALLATHVGPLTPAGSVTVA